MFAVLVSVPTVGPVRHEYWSIPSVGLERFNHEQWAIRSGPGLDVYEGEGADRHDIIARTYWERRED